MTSAAPTGADDQAAVVLRNVAELAQRQQARELGAALALQIFRLLKIVGFHALDNMTVLQQLDQTIEALRGFGVQTGEAMTMLFSKGTVFVAGHLLKASRGEYESALELGEMVKKLGVSEITIQTDATRADLTALCRLFVPGSKAPDHEGVIDVAPSIRLRYVNPARLGEDEEDLTPEEQIVRTYATAVVVMRRVYENLLVGRYQLPHQAKRLAQRLVMLSEGDTPAFLGITAMRNLNHDAAGRAVNRAILAVTVARQLTNDLGSLARIAMSALFFDVAEPLVTGMVGRGNDVVVMHMTEDAERRLPAATGLVLTALGQLRHASMVRSVVTYEAHWLRQIDALGPMYGGSRKPMVAPRIVVTAHRFNQLLEPDLAAARTPTPDEALTSMRGEARDATERAMLALLIGALGLFPRGTPVQLNTGERGVTLHTPGHPAEYVRPTIRLVYDATGQPLRSHVAIDLTQDPARTVVGVVANPDALLIDAIQKTLATPRSVAPPPPPDSVPPPSSEPEPLAIEAEPAPLELAPEAEPMELAPEPEPMELLPEPEPMELVPEPAPPPPEPAPAPRARAAASSPVAPPLPSRSKGVVRTPSVIRDATPPPTSSPSVSRTPSGIRDPTPPPRVGPPVARNVMRTPSVIRDDTPPPTSSPSAHEEAMALENADAELEPVELAPAAPRMPSVPPGAPGESHSVAVTIGGQDDAPAPVIERRSVAPPGAGPQTERRRAPPPRKGSAVAPPSISSEFEDVLPDAQEISEVEPSAPSSHWRRPPATIPPSQRDELPAGFSDASHAPSASGSFERTPFSHILLYLLDRNLTGTLIFTEPADRPEDVPVEHAGFFRDGVPTKIHTQTRVSPLGSLLVAGGVIEQSQLESEPISQPPTHEATLEGELLDFGLANASQIAEVRNEQLSERLTYLFSLPHGTKYSFYNGLDLLEAIWGNIPGVVSPLGVLTRGLRVHPEEKAMDRVLTRVAGYALHLHPDADLVAFELDDAEMQVAETIREKAASLPDLVEAGFDPDVIRRVVYELMITRCLAPAAAAPPSTRSGSEPSSVRKSGRPSGSGGKSTRKA